MRRDVGLDDKADAAIVAAVGLRTVDNGGVVDRHLAGFQRHLGRGRRVEIADGLGISVTTLATAWSKQHDFVASTIIGATTVEQLNETLAAEDLVLGEETLAQIDQVEREIPLSFGEDGLRFK